MPSVKEYVDIGFNLHQDGKLEEAESAYNEALSIDSGNAEVCNLLGVLKLQQGDIALAVEYVEKAIEKSPQAYFFETLFQAYIRNNDYEKIIAKKDLVIKLFPDNFSLLFNIALAYKNIRNNKEAIKFYEKALKIDPTSYQGWFNLAHLYSVEAQTANAVSAMEICKKLNPKDSETRYFYSIALLREKNYNKGLKYFESRLCREAAVEIQKKTYPNKVRDDNFWHGERIKNKTLLVYYEAGFGDVIQFVRYLPIVAKLCKKLIFICQKPLTPLFKENSQLGVAEYIDSFVPESRLDFDVHAPLMSLPYILGLKDDDIFAFSGGYLRANQNKYEEAKKKYFDNYKIKIGIKWQGNTYFDKDRVIPAEMFKHLIGIENTQFYSFQTFEGSEESAKLKDIVDVGKDLVDFSQTAAALCNLDLVICNDTSLAHLAGALGIPCWIILPWEVNWRWHTDLSVCDWYSSVRLFRQEKMDDWNDVFNKVAQEIKTAISE